MNTKAAKILMILVILTRASAYVFSKIALQELSPFLILGYRFTIACLLLMAVFAKRLYGQLKLDHTILWKSLVLGISLFITMIFEMYSLETADVHMAALMENTAIIQVPLLLALYQKKLPSKKIAMGGALIILGVFGLTYSPESGLHFSVGEMYALGAAFFYALYIIATGVIVKNTDGFSVGVLQMGVLGILSFGASAVFEGGSLALPQQSSTYLALAVLILMCSCFGFTFQPVAQKYVSAEDTAMLCSLNPLFSVFLGAVIFHETLGTLGLFGAFCILGGIFYVNKPTKKVSIFPAHTKGQSTVMKVCSQR